MKKLLFLFWLFVFCCMAAPAQNYQVTEEQLQELETICQSYKQLRQKQQEQVNELMEDSASLTNTLSKLKNEVKTLKTESETLRDQLTKERSSTSSLNISLKKYEIEDAAKAAQILELTQRQAEYEIQIGKLKKQNITLLLIIMFVFILIAGYIFILLKRK